MQTHNSNSCDQDDSNQTTDEPMDKLMDDLICHLTRYLKQVDPDSRKDHVKYIFYHLAASHNLDLVILPDSPTDKIQYLMDLILAKFHYRHHTQPERNALAGMIGQFMQDLVQVINFWHR